MRQHCVSTRHFIVLFLFHTRPVVAVAPSLVSLSASSRKKRRKKKRTQIQQHRFKPATHNGSLHGNSWGLFDPLMYAAVECHQLWMRNTRGSQSAGIESWEMHGSVVSCVFGWKDTTQPNVHWASLKAYGFWTKQIHSRLNSISYLGYSN